MTIPDIVCIAVCAAILAVGGFVVHMLTERRPEARR